ncbi:MAG: hypothetical protein JXQ68_04205 [Campylobacterales bacterium]|nr:hypothetical protein [Campylobacterales bacterium]
MARVNILALITIVFSCSLADALEDQFISKEIADYPYVASEERVSFIKTNYKKIKKNMSSDEVKSILGEPDEIRALYEPIKKDAKIIGYTYWYIIYREKNNGIKNKSLVRISFDLTKRVIDIIYW